MSRREDWHEKIKLYIENVEQAIEKLKNMVDERAARIVELAEAYMQDSKYYLERNDVFTALATIAYAEGLLDALRWLNIADFEWKPLSQLAARPKVLVAGSFEILHEGHVHLLEKAHEQGRVYVIVARDENVKRFKKRDPITPLEQRMRLLSAIRYVYRVLAGDPNDILKPILDVKPDIILLGPDQWVDEKWLAEELAKRGLKPRIIRLEERKKCKLCSTTEIACRILETFPRERC